MLLLKRVVLGVLCLFSSAGLYSEERQTIHVAVQMSYADERKRISQLLSNFELSHPHVNIEIRVFRGDYTEQILEWIRLGKGPDVIYWYSGEHIRRLAKNGALSDLSEIWSKFDLGERLNPRGREAVSYKGKEYGLPISYYPWAIYFRQKSFDALGMPVPHTWSEWLNSCKTLSEKNINLFALSNKEMWPILAWFDYLALRLWGKEFHAALLRGERRWDGEEVKVVLEHFKALIENDCFNVHNHRKLDLRGALPLLYHDSALMTLSGAYIMGNLPDEMKSQFRLMPFPSLNKDIPSHTVVPIDAFIVPAYVEMNSMLQAFLLYLSEAHFQLALNEPSARLPVNISAQKTLRHHLQIKAIDLINSTNTTQYFDRESHPELALIISSELVKFIENPDVDWTLGRLEKKGRAFYKKVNDRSK